MKSKDLFNLAKKVIPSGVNSPVRYFEPYPFYVKKARGSSIWDEDGNRYTDFCNGYGALLLGHRNKEVISAVKKQLDIGTMYGAPSAAEIDLSKLIIKNYPSMQKIRLVNSGSEATMTAIRLARGITKKKKILKFEGCYHGAHESMLVKAGSGSAHNGISISDGIPEDFSKNTVVVQYNDIEQLESVISKNKDIAGVIVEPVLANMGLVLPQKNYLKEMRKITKQHNIPLIFDEIVTGFRLGVGGAQEYFGIAPDITTLGKALSNGFVISAVGGRRDIMDQLAPNGKVYEASTFAGNPVSVAAGITSIKTMIALKNKLYPKLEQYCSVLSRTISELADDMQIPHQLNHISSMFQIFFSDSPVVDYKTSKRSDTKKFHRFFHHLLKQGIFIPPSQFETAFFSYAHTADDIEKTVDAYRHALKMVKN
ncbi:glutamate-1-semialdehyde 2,1-aminomutase [Candidatus Nitrosotenuis sp. DW1]|uniref:glutamate-1-semialdehyde 2,1-aminomutase n=1 Tax=Candidatus Nitrosotenuis sp. DW1 TaxID=2259672 RepID=UPI0015C991C9|nr:glutamate-1-semialdehyde 2,1-aminomutase [Candidatus Nitrosotenuis sp. DW1]QLH08495.1 glutamate-1-semialdehyde-2,1-aminomutase [Candidatus Nitrosotenuis sp. DW1]